VRFSWAENRIHQHKVEKRASPSMLHTPLSDPVYPDDIGILGFSQFSAAGFQCDGGKVKCGGCNNSFKMIGIGNHFHTKPQCWELAQECRRTQMRAVIEFWDKF
jgi:hypothetical protein